jgi:hypothetical protein
MDPVTMLDDKMGTFSHRVAGRPELLVTEGLGLGAAAAEGGIK